MRYAGHMTNHADRNRFDHHGTTCPNHGLGWKDPRALYCLTYCLSYVPKHKA